MSAEKWFYGNIKCCEQFHIYFRIFLLAFRIALSLTVSRESGSVDRSVIKKRKESQRKKKTETTKLINN